MLNKLIKYDLKSLSKLLLPASIIVLSLAVFNRIGYNLATSVSLMKVPYTFIAIFYFIAVFFLPVVVCIVSGVRFYHNLIKDEGYLMNTLPVKKSSLILSKLISFVICLIVSILISALAIVIGCYNVYFGSEEMNLVVELLHKVDTLFIVLLCLTFFVGIIMQQLMIYLGITFGQRHSKNKGVMSFVYIIAVYYVTQIVTSSILLIPMTLNKNWAKYLDVDMPPMRVLNIFLLISLIISLVIAVVYYVITKYNMEKKLNLD